MSAPQYTALASCYDRLNAEIDYEAWADFLDRIVAKHGIPTDNLWLDLACGTGTITLALAKRGHNMIGADLSSDMLNIAMQKAQDAGQEGILWLRQDMRSFELYGTVDAVVCCLDSINYIPSREGLAACFSLVNTYLNPNGIFIFDVNTPKKFREVYGSNDYILESDGLFCGWHNCFDEKTGICTFDLSIFVQKQKSGTYIRMDEQQKEYCYSMRTICHALEHAGLELIGVYSDFDCHPAKEDSERWFFVCRESGKNGILASSDTNE